MNTPLPIKSDITSRASSTQKSLACINNFCVLTFPLPATLAPVLFQIFRGIKEATNFQSSIYREGLFTCMMKSKLPTRTWSMRAYRSHSIGSITGSGWRWKSAFLENLCWLLI
jgi:hypothetical protein